MDLSSSFLPWVLFMISLAIIATINGVEFTLKLQALRTVLAHADCHPGQLDETSPPILRLKSARLTFAEYDNIYSVESDDDWAALIPRGNGFLYPQDSETVRLGSNITVYGVSLFHQLHCVDMMRKIYIFAKNGELAAHADEEMHMLHCFNYLRQGLLCAADTTLEPEYWRIDNSSYLSLLSKAPKDSLRGLGFTHVCRDALPLKEAMAQSHFTFNEALRSLAREI